MKSQDSGAVLFQVAWLAFALGVAMEVLTLCITIPAGTVSGFRAVLAETVQKVSWSWIVCFGVAAGSTVQKLRLPAMGLAGLVAAPLGFQIARVLHRAASQALGIAAPAGGGPSPLAIAAVKGVEYACLGLLLAAVAKRTRGGFAVHAAAGAICGLVFGSVILWMTLSTAKQVTLLAVAPKAINELLFPVGCALVVYGAQIVAQRLPITAPRATP